MSKKTVLTGAIFIALAIILGAFGAHGLKDVLTEAQSKSFETGVRYQTYHGLALLILGFNASKFKGINTILYLVLAGVIVFSGSIYLLATQDVLGASLSFLGPITPIGGVLMIAAWGVFIVKIMRS
ncbi:MAG: DUF423 domain-containing protein [Crocinitomicaceae bacterium]|jgi:uncharacterized membrane protein YgdD (TMEM256/DUF423 family)